MLFKLINFVIEELENLGPGSKEFKTDVAVAVIALKKILKYF